MDHLLREQQRSLPDLPPYRSLDISRQIPANQNGHRKDNYQAWKPLTQYTLNVLRGWCFRTSAAAQDDHSTQNTIFAGQKGWAWMSRANATSETTTHTEKKSSTASFSPPQKLPRTLLCFVTQYIISSKIHGSGLDKLRSFILIILISEKINPSFQATCNCGQFKQLKVIILSLCVYFIWQAAQQTTFYSICMDRCLAHSKWPAGHVI